MKRPQPRDLLRLCAEQESLLKQLKSYASSDHASSDHASSDHASRASDRDKLHVLSILCRMDTAIKDAATVIMDGASARDRASEMVRLFRGKDIATQDVRVGIGGEDPVRIWRNTRADGAGIAFRGCDPLGGLYEVAAHSDKLPDENTPENTPTQPRK